MNGRWGGTHGWSTLHYMRRAIDWDVREAEK